MSCSYLFGSSRLLVAQPPRLFVACRRGRRAMLGTETVEHVLEIGGKRRLNFDRCTAQPLEAKVVGMQELSLEAERL